MAFAKKKQTYAERFFGFELQRFVNPYFGRLPHGTWHGPRTHQRPCQTAERKEFIAVGPAHRAGPKAKTAWAKIVGAVETLMALMALNSCAMEGGSEGVVWCLPEEAIWVEFRSNGGQNERASLRGIKTITSQFSWFNYSKKW